MMSGLMLGLIAFAVDFGHAANYSGNVTIRPMSPTALWSCTLQPKDTAAFSVTVIHTESGYRLKSGPTAQITGQDVLWTGGPTTFHVVNESPEVASTVAKVTCVWEPYGGGPGPGPRPPDIYGEATGTAQLKVGHIEWSLMPTIQAVDNAINWDVKLVNDYGALVSGMTVNFTLSAVNVSPAASWTIQPEGGPGPALSGTVSSSGGSRGNLKVNYTYFGKAKSSTSGQITFVEVESLLPDVGQEIDDGDGDPDTKTFVVDISINAGDVVTVTATPNPSVDESDLPDCWTLTGGIGSSKLERTIDRTTPSGPNVLTCTCGTSEKITTVWVVHCTYTAYADKTVLSEYEIGHGWWRFGIEPANATTLIQPPNVRIWANQEAGYFPKTAGSPHGPGKLVMGDQGHAPTSQHTWNIPFILIDNGLTFCRDLAASPGIYDLYYNNCCDQVIASSCTCGVNIPGDKDTPTKLHDYLSGL